MKRIFLTLFFLIGLLAINSCVRDELSPSINFRNSSSDGGVVRNMEVIWNGYALLKESGPDTVCRGGGGQSFNLKKRSDFFGPVHAEWENAKGQKIAKDFIFKKEDFPSFAKGAKFDNFKYPQVYLFFTQSDVEYYTSDNPNIRRIQREKQGNWVYKWFEKEKEDRCVNDPEELKRIRAISKKYPNISTTTGKPVDEE